MNRIRAANSYISTLAYIAEEMQANQIPKPPLIIGMIAVAIGFWLFSPFPLYFLNDDFIHIPLSKDGTWFQRNSFRPVCDLSIAIDYFLWRKIAWGYHLTNLILHVFNACMVYVLSSRLYKRYSKEKGIWLSWFAAVLFFIYPFHSEGIYWIIGRSGSLGALFFLPAVIFYLQRNEHGFYFLLSAVFFAMGLLTYESVWIFPLVAVGLSWLDKKSYRYVFNKEAKYVLSLSGIFVLFLVIKIVLIGQVVGVYEANSFLHFNVKELLLNWLRLYTRSFAPPVISTITFIFTSIVLLLLTILALLIFKNKRLLYFLMVVFAISLLPYLSLGIDTHGVEGERYLYLPSIFVCIMAMYLITLVSKKLNVRLLIFVAISGSSIFFLFKSRAQYLAASNISKTTIQALEQIKNKQRLFIDSLPQEVNGALVFRLGFYEALEWMKTGQPFKNVFVTSGKENASNWNKHYEIIDADTSAINDKQRAGYNYKTDAFIIFSHTGLVVKK